MVRPQNQKSSVAGSPSGHLQVRSVSSISEILRAFFSTSRTEANASGLISPAEGCGGRGWPAGMICLRVCVPRIVGIAAVSTRVTCGFVSGRAALGAAALWPNVYEITAKNDPLVDSRKWIKPDVTNWSWAPNLNWALATGFLLALALMSVFSAAPSEFLYFRF